MKILMVSNLLPPDYDGGQEVNALKLAHQLRNRGHDVEMVTSTHRPTYQGPPEDREWVHRILTIRRRWDIPNRTGWANKYDLVKRQIQYEQTFIHNYRVMKRFLSGRTYDVAYIAGLGMVGRSLVMAITEAGIPCLYHSGDNYLGEHWTNYSVSRLFDLMYNTALREVKRTEHGADRRHFAFVSQFLADEVAGLGLPMDNVYVIPRGIEFPLGSDLERPRDTPPVILIAGRVTPDKGYHVAVEAFGRLHQAAPERPWVVHVYGKDAPDAHPEYLGGLKESLRKYGAEHRVEFKGQVPREQLLERYRRATAVLSSATWGEPFGNTIIESLALGTPLIGSKVGSIEEVVVDGVHALLYESQDAEALMGCVDSVLTDWPAAQARAARGIALIDEKYRIETIIEQTEALLAQVAASGPV